MPKANKKSGDDWSESQSAFDAVLIVAYADAIRPPPRLTVSQWADKNRVLSSEASAEPGRWRTDRAEYSRGIMDAVCDPLVKTVVWMSSAQVGKALALDTEIPTPNGWTSMGELCPGDMVFDESGQPCTVLRATDVMRGRVCYDVVFSDGQKIVADAEHQWFVESNTPLIQGKPWHGAGSKSGILTTEQMAATYRDGKRNRYAVPVSDPLLLPEREFTLNPYTFGVWLGDGNSASAQITVGSEDIENMLQNLLDDGGSPSIVAGEKTFTVRLDAAFSDRKVCRRGHILSESGRTKSGYCAECARQASQHYQRGRAIDKICARSIPVSEILRNLGVINNKHIPPEYLRGSIGQRTALLQGLMDTDGYVDARGRCEFVTTSNAIAYGFSDLLAGLGIKFTSSIKSARCKYKGVIVQGKPAHRFSFLAYADKPMFRLRRKLERQKARAGCRTTETERRRIVSVQRVDSVPVRCIEVDSHSHLYLAGRGMIPTHNTEFLLNVCGYYIHHDPAPMLLVQPTIDMAQAFSKDRLAPMVRECDALAERVQDGRITTGTASTILHKVFPGGHITMAGANSPASLASRPVRNALMDEVDRYPVSAGAEGDPVSLARKRTTTFWNRKILLTSTPTIKGHSRIERAYEESDQRRYWVPCPKCRAPQVLIWGQVKWPAGDPAAAYYECGEHDPETGEVCGHHWSDVERWAAIKTAPQYGGGWRASAPFAGIAGFHTNEIISSWVRLGDMAVNFVEAKRGGPESLKTFVNTSLGETWEEQGERVDEAALESRKASWGDELPAGVAVVTAGVDFQDDRFEIEVTGWGVNEESWSLDYIVIRGDPSAPDMWKRLDEVLQTKYRHSFLEKEMGIHAACLDTGGSYTQKVYGFCRDRWSRHVWGIKGMGGPGKKIWPPRHTKTKKSGIPIFIIGVDAAKETTYSYLKVNEPGAGYCWFPKSRDDEYFRQLTAEETVTKYVKSFPQRAWQLKQGHKRNEALDVRVYAYAALHGLIARGLKLNARCAKLGLPERDATEGDVRVAQDPRANPDEVVAAATPEAVQGPKMVAKSPQKFKRRRVSRSGFMS